MSSQTTMAALPAEKTTALRPLDALKPMLNSNGELELSSLGIGERVQKFIDFRESCNFNLPLWDSAILSQFPPGTTLVPVPVVPAKGDAWRGAEARKMQLKEGHVEPSADFILRLGNIAGVQLQNVFEGINKETGLWSCRYDARIQLPNGEWLTIQNEGKDQEAFNNDGSKKAHISEATRKKAKRNVVKNLLGIPTSMPEPEFDRAWVILKPVFKAGVSAETDLIIAENKRLAGAATAKLYGNIVDVSAEPANKDGEVTVDGWIQRIKDTKTMADLDELIESLGNIPMTMVERKPLADAYAAQKKALSAQTAEVKL